MPDKRRTLPLILAAVLVASVALYFWFSRPEPVAVIVATVTPGTVQSTAANTRAGTIKACRRAGISPSIGGQIARMPVRKGDAVVTGQLLMELWNADQMAQLALASSEAVAAAAAASQACIKSQVAAREADRLQQLRGQNLVSEEAVDRADGEARALQAACEAAQANREVSKAKILVVEAALERTRLSAPFAGVVAELNGEIGEFVTPSPVGIPTPPAVDLVDASCLYVSAPIDEVDAPKIRVGMAANISLDAMAGQIFAGKVRRIAPYVLEVEKQARTVDVEVDFACAQEACTGMLPGYSADIEVILEQREGVPRIPTEALLQGDKVLVFANDNTLQQRGVEIGLSNWTWTEIVDGLNEGEEIVVSVERERAVDGALARRDTQTKDD